MINSGLLLVDRDGTIQHSNTTAFKLSGSLERNSWECQSHCSRQDQHEEELLWQATHDSMTDLPNRTLILQRLKVALERTSDTKKGSESFL